jgi:Uma2 family endonuclease
MENQAMGDIILSGDLESIDEADIDDDVLYEVVAGQRVELPPMSAFETVLATVLSAHLCDFAMAKGLGRVATETLFLLRALGEKEERRPDVAFVSYRRWPRNRRVPRTKAWDVAPDLAVEVVSPTNTANQVLTKIREYFQGGVERVWVIYPELEEVYVYSSPTQPRVLSRADDLDGDTVLPGFRLPIATLFEDESTDQDPAS